MTSALPVVDLSFEPSRQHLNRWLLRAASGANLSLARRFLRQGAQPFALVDQRSSPFREAVLRTDLPMMRAMLEGGRAPTPVLIEAAVALQHASISSSASTRRKVAAAARLLLDAAGDEASQVAAKMLRQRSLFKDGIRESELFERLDFFEKTPAGQEWLLALARLRGKRARETFDQVLAAWGERPLPCENDGGNLAQLAARCDNVGALKALSRRGDFESLCAAWPSPLKLCAGHASPSCFLFLLSRLPASFNPFGRDVFTQTLIDIQGVDFISSSFDLKKACLALAGRAHPSARDALGRTFADWAALLGQPQARKASLAKTAPPPPQAEFSPDIRDQAMLDEILRLARSCGFNPSAKVESEVMAWAKKLSNLRATQTHFGLSALGIACQYGFFKLARFLVQAGAPLDVKEGLASPLAVAIMCSSTRWSNPRQKSLVRFLVNASPSTRLSSYESSAFEFALRNNAPAGVARLLLPQADLPERWRRLLDSAAPSNPGAFDMVWRAAFKKGRLAPWAQPSNDACWPESLAKGPRADVLVALLNQGGPWVQRLTQRRVGGASLLGWAAQGNNPQTLRKLLPFFDPNATDEVGRDALMIAMDHYSFENAKALIALCDLSRRDALGLSALERAQIFSQNAHYAHHGAQMLGLIQARLAAAREERALRAIAPKNAPRRSLRM